MNNFLRTTFYIIFITICFKGILGLKGPSNITILSYNETEVAISWNPVNLYNVNVTGYLVKISPIQSNSPSHGTMAVEISTAGSKTMALVNSLHPGTQYNITIVASTVKNNLTEPSSLIFWTEVGKPDKPPQIDILERTATTMKVKLYPGESDKGPISSIRVIVLEKTTIISFNEEQLYNYSIAEESGLPFYITASLKESEIGETFVIGDGKMYGGYFNAPLKEELNYEVLQGTISTLNGVTKAAYSPLQSTIINLDPVYYTRPNEFQSQSLPKILGIALGIFGFLLIVSFVLYFLLRRHYGKRRLSDEMVLHDQITDVEENGFAQGVRLGENVNLGDFWEILKERYWSIPKNLLEISEQVLGNGHFGEVRKGVVHKRGKPITVFVQLTQNQSIMGDKEKLSLYSEIDAELRLSSHPNVAEFVGICEDKGILHLVGECYDTSLRGLLLRSRLQTGPRFANVSENFILDLALGISKGMKYISDFGVMHKHLSSRSVAISDSYQPKITNFGLFFYHPAGKKLDYSRWLAPEAGRTRYTSKCDVWSFGVLLWEICTLGGTPYSDTLTSEIYPRTMRGLRLPHPVGVSDELFQLMLQCWELDPDERPTFQELLSVLENMTLSPTEHLCFERTGGFQFHKFDPKGDEQ